VTPLPFTMCRWLLLLIQPDSSGSASAMPAPHVGPRMVTRLPWCSCAVPLGRTPEYYPEVADSVLVWDAFPQSTRTFPVAAREVGWTGSELLMDTGDATLRVEMRSGEVRGAWARGTQISQDNRYSAVVLGREGLRVWRSHPTKSELTDEVMQTLKGASIQEVPRPFWVEGGAGHVLCLGVRLAVKAAELPSKVLIWRTLFIDVERMKVVRSLDARLVAPTVSHRKAVVRRGEAFEFVTPGEGK